MSSLSKRLYNSDTWRRRIVIRRNIFCSFVKRFGDLLDIRMFTAVLERHVAVTDCWWCLMNASDASTGIRRKPTSETIALIFDAVNWLGKLSNNSMTRQQTKRRRCSQTLSVWQRTSNLSICLVSRELLIMAKFGIPQFWKSTLASAKNVSTINTHERQLVVLLSGNTDRDANLLSVCFSRRTNLFACKFMHDCILPWQIKSVTPSSACLSVKNCLRFIQLPYDNKIYPFSNLLSQKNCSNWKPNNRCLWIFDQSKRQKKAITLISTQHNIT